MSHFVRILIAFAVMASAGPALGQSKTVPYWASIRAEKVHMRVGPSLTYKIDWVYKRSGLPVRVLRRMEGWRLIEDPDGARGWMLGRFLTLDRTAIVDGDRPAEMRAQANDSSALLWRLEPGVSGALGQCDAGWCVLQIKGTKGFVKADRLWGDGAP